MKGGDLGIFMDIQSFDQRFQALRDKIFRKGASRTLEISTVDVQSLHNQILTDTFRQAQSRHEKEKLLFKNLLDEKDSEIKALRDKISSMESDRSGMDQQMSSFRDDLQKNMEVSSWESVEQETRLKNVIQHYELEITKSQSQIHTLELTRQELQNQYNATLSRWKEEKEQFIRLIEKRDQQIAELGTALQDEKIRHAQDARQFQEKMSQWDQRLKDEQTEASAREARLRESMNNRDGEVQDLQHILHLAQEEIVQHMRAQQKFDSQLKSSEARIQHLLAELETLRQEREIERAQWRELWERERSSHEKLMKDVKDMNDERSRQNEFWLQNYKAELSNRQKAYIFFENIFIRLTQNIREWGVPQARDTHQKHQEYRQILSPPRPGLLAETGSFLAQGLRWARKITTRKRSWTSGGLLVSILAAGTAFYLRQGPLVLPGPVSHMGGLAVSGTTLWTTDWMSGQIVSFDLQKSARMFQIGQADPSYHPMTLRLADDRLWSLDPWSKMIHQHTAQPPYARVQSWACPLESPVDMTWDGQSFWVLDKQGGRLNQYRPSKFESPLKTVDLPRDWNISFVDYRDGDFWGYDTSNQRLLRFRLTSPIRLISEHRLPRHESVSSPVTGLAVSGDAVWTVSEKSQEIYRWDKRILLSRAFLKKVISR